MPPSHTEARDQMDEVAGKSDAAEMSRARVAAGGNRREREYGGRARPTGGAARRHHDRREQHRGHRQAGVSGRVREEVRVQRPGADPAARVRRVRERRDQRAYDRRRADPDRHAPLPAADLAPAAVGQQPRAWLAPR